MQLRTAAALLLLRAGQCRTLVQARLIMRLLVDKLPSPHWRAQVDALGAAQLQDDGGAVSVCVQLHASVYVRACCACMHLHARAPDPASRWQGRTFSSNAKCAAATPRVFARPTSHHRRYLDKVDSVAYMVNVLGQTERVRSFLIAPARSDRGLPRRPVVGTAVRGRGRAACMCACAWLGAR